MINSLTERIIYDLETEIKTLNQQYNPEKEKYDQNLLYDLEREESTELIKNDLEKEIFTLNLNMNLETYKARRVQYDLEKEK